MLFRSFCARHSECHLMAQNRYSTVRTQGRIAQDLFKVAPKVYLLDRCRCDGESLGRVYREGYWCLEVRESSHRDCGLTLAF